MEKETKDKPRYLLRAFIHFKGRKNVNSLSFLFGILTLISPFNVTSKTEWLGLPVMDSMGIQRTVSKGDVSPAVRILAL